MMSRKSWVWGGVALVLGLALGWNFAGPGVVFGENPDLTGTTKALQPSLSPAPVSDAKLKVLAQALALVEQQYPEPKTTKDLVYGAIQGAMGTLDPHSSFMTPDEFRELQIETKGKFSGIGIEISLKDRVLTVVSPIEGTPAYQAGLKAGDQILKINGTSTKNITLMEAVKMIRGAQGEQGDPHHQPGRLSASQGCGDRSGNYSYPQCQGAHPGRRHRLCQGDQFSGFHRSAICRPTSRR